METKIIAMFSMTVLLGFCVISPSQAMPSEVKPNEAESVDQSSQDRRATWLETRNLEENFKELVYLSIQELISEGRISPEMAVDKVPASKRGRHQGFCFKKTKSGRFLPYICWKGEGDQEE